MHPYYGVNHLNQAVPTTLATVEQLNAVPSEQSSQPESEILSIENSGEEPAPPPIYTQIPVVPGASSIRVSGNPEMNNLGSNFSFPSPQQQYGVGFSGASSGNNGQHFQFLNPTFSGPPVQMMAPGCGNLAMWQHTIPSTMPWSSSSNNSCGQFKFSATPLSTAVATTAAAVSAAVASNSSIPQPGTSANSHSLSNGHYNIRCPRKQKRKAATPSEETALPASKVFVNEERMAARLEQLQLDNNNLHWHPNLEEDWCSQRSSSHPPRSLRDIDSRLSLSEDEEEVSEDRMCQKNDEAPHLELSEILQLRLRTKNMLPQVLLDEINKPCMQVVLWKPPGNFVQEVVRNVTHSMSLPEQGSSSACTMGTNSCTSANGDSMDVQDLPILPGSTTFTQPRNGHVISPPIWNVTPGANQTVQDDDDDMDL